MRRYVYSFNGEDYNSSSKVSLNFRVAKSNLETVLNIFRSVGIRPQVKEDIVINFGSVERQAKLISVNWYASYVYDALCKLGHRESSFIKDNIAIYKRDYDKSRPQFVKGKFIKWNKLDGYKLVDNTPRVVNGNQIVHCGSIYRRNNLVV